MNDEQLRAEFEAWLYLDQTKYDPERMSKQEIEIAKLAYQAGRAAPQSQDREDAERYRALVASGHFVPAPTPYFNIWGLRTTEGKATKAELDAAIDAIRALIPKGTPCDT